MNDQVATVSHAKDTLIELAIRFGPRLLIAVLVLVVGIFLAAHGLLLADDPRARGWKSIASPRTQGSGRARLRS